jgi:integrase
MSSLKRRHDGSWRARYLDPEGRERARHFDRKVDAEHWLATIEADIVRGTYLDPLAGRVTFQEHADRWLTQQPHRPNTSRLYRRTLRLHVYPAIGEMPLSSLRRSDIQTIVGSLSANGYKPKTIENVVRLVRAICNAAVDDGLIAVSPVRRVTRPVVQQRHVVPLPLDGVRRAADSISPRLRALVLLSVGTGLRQGEALGLTVDRVDFLRKEITVESPAHQGGRHCTRARAAQDQFVAPCRSRAGLCHRSVGRAPRGVSGRRERVCVHRRTWPAGCTCLAAQSVAASSCRRRAPGDTTWHMLRHTYASVLIDGGESVTVVARRLGHANPSETLRTYSHLWPESDERTRQVVEAAFGRSGHAAIGGDQTVGSMGDG